MITGDSNEGSWRLLALGKHHYYPAKARSQFFNRTIHLLYFCKHVDVTELFNVYRGINLKKNMFN